MELRKIAYKFYRKIVRFKKTLRISQKVEKHISGKSMAALKIYYFFFNHSFDREMQSVFLGKKIFKQRLAKRKPNISKVRREVHRIEKGLIIPVRKPFFANNYIDSTVASLIDSYAELDSLNQKWMLDVLTQYFNEIGNGNSNIDASRVTFNTFKASLSNKETLVTSVPFSQNQLIENNVSFSDLLNLAKRRHSTRFFNDKKIEKEVLYNAVKVGLEAPSACNRQPFEVLFIDDVELLKKAVKLPMGVATFSTEIKNFAIVVGDLSYYSEERDRHLIYVDGALFTMSFLFGLETQGVSSCVVNWPDIETRETAFHRLFNIPIHKRGICFIALGYANEDGLIPYSEKKEAQNIIKFNEQYTHH